MLGVFAIRQLPSDLFGVLALVNPASNWSLIGWPFCFYGSEIGSLSDYGEGLIGLFIAVLIGLFAKSEVIRRAVATFKTDRNTNKISPLRLRRKGLLRVEAAGIEPASRDISVGSVYVRRRIISAFRASRPNRRGAFPR